MVDGCIGPDIEVRRARKARHRNIYLATIGLHRSLKLLGMGTQRLDIHCKMATCTIGIAINRDDTLAIYREHYRAVGRSLTLLTGIRRLTLQIEVVATKIRIGRDIHLLATINCRIGINQKTINSRRCSKGLCLPGREVPLRGLTHRLERHATTLNTGDINRYTIIGQRFQPLNCIGMCSLLIARQLEYITILRSGCDANLINSSRCRPAKRNGIGRLLQNRYLMFIAGRKTRRTTHSCITAQVHRVERSGLQARQRIDTGSLRSLVELDCTHTIIHIQVGNIRACQPAQHS